MCVFPTNVTLELVLMFIHHTVRKEMYNLMYNQIIDKQPKKRVTLFGEIKKDFINNAIFNLTFEGSSPEAEVV